MLRIQNQGNASGSFNWILTDQKIFTISPLSGEVPAGGEHQCVVTYKPSGKSLGKSEEEKLMIRVLYLYFIFEEMGRILISFN